MFYPVVLLCFVCVVAIEKGAYFSSPGSLVESSSVESQVEDECEPINWLDYKTEFGISNSIINFAANSTLVHYVRDQFDEVLLEVDRQIPLEKKFMGATHIVETIATKIHIAGLKYIQLRPIEVNDDKTLIIRASSDDTLVITADIDMKYTKKMESFLGFEYCPYEWFFWVPCPTRIVAVDSKIAIKKMSIKTKLQLEVYRCNRQRGFWSQVACRFSSAYSFMTSLFDNDNMVNNGFLAEMLKRMKSARVDDPQVKVESVKIKTNVAVDIINSGKDEIEKDAELHIKEQLTAGVLRDAIFKGISFATKQAANGAIKVVEPLFQSRCYRR